MKRVLSIVALAAVTGCASQSAYSGGAASTAAPPASEQGSAEGSNLSPEQVRIVQRSLADRGFAVDLTGTLDDRTQTALMDFQRARGLETTGQVDASTIDALGIDPRDVAPVRGLEPDTEEELHGTSGG
jgi:peptidoglycan hydrolase-like protein with peptidoglycan-binding domain